MSDLIAVLGGLISSLGNVRSADVLKEHVALLTSKLQLVQEGVVKLEAENAGLVRRNRELEEQLARAQPPEELVKHRGALFQRLVGGGYDETPLCPKCRGSLWAFAEGFPYECSTDGCNHKANFEKQELAKVMRELPK